VFAIGVSHGVQQINFIIREIACGKSVEGAARARRLGLEVHAGHGLDLQTAEAIAAFPEIVELNIGHFLIGEAIFDGLAGTVKAMRAAMDRGVARRP